MLNTLLSGAIAMGTLVISLFFLRFWKSTRDRFFLFFALSFLLEAANRAFLGLTPGQTEHEPFYYLIRLVSYLLILFAIIDKNRRRKSSG